MIQLFSMEAMDPRLGVIIPCYNEEQRIGKTLQVLKDWTRQNPHLKIRWLFVDDGSQDATHSILLNETSSLNAEILRLPKNQGKGAACRTGALELSQSQDYVLFMDADLATDLKHLKETLEKFQSPLKPQVVIGNRRHALSKVQRKKSRSFVSSILTRICRLALGLKHSDTQCGFKGFTSSAAKELFEPLESRGFAFDLEILARAKRLGFKVSEIPVNWKEVPGSKMGIHTDMIRFFREVGRIRRILKKEIRRESLPSQAT